MRKLTILFIIPFFVFCQVDYNTEIQPILDAKCTSCHQGAAAYFGGLSLTSYDDLMEGGNTAGGIITTGLLENYITTGYMPPYGAGASLNTEEIDLITQWISEGALEEIESTSVLEHSKSKKIIQILNYMGKSVRHNGNGLLIYIYEDGRSEKKININYNSQ
tara:strand:- start:289 stop:774 length:486 start_codon:yes stop_codon:yes gene_type:complete